jgi:hypothetical protein
MALLLIFLKWWLFERIRRMARVFQRIPMGDIPMDLKTGSIPKFSMGAWVSLRLFCNPPAPPATADLNSFSPTTASPVCVRAAPIPFAPIAASAGAIARPIRHVSLLCTLEDTD